MDQAIRKALAPVPADRFAGMAEFARRLRGGRRASNGAKARGRDTVSRSRAETREFAAAAGPSAASAGSLSAAPSSLSSVGILIGLGVLFAWRRAKPGSAPAKGAALAVLPFENLGAPEDGYFADGLTDEVRGKLIALPGLQVTARSSSVEYKGTRKSPCSRSGASWAWITS